MIVQSNRCNYLEEHDSLIYLRSLSKNDVSDNYVEWMNCYDIVKFTESKYLTHTTASVLKYVNDCNESDNNLLYGIFLRNSDIHIGNIKLGNIHSIYSHADIGLIIGMKEYWGRGIATSAINMITKYGFNVLDLHKIFAGAYAENIGSQKAFLKAGYKIAYIKKDDVFFENHYEDCIILEKYNPNHEMLS